MISWPAVFLLVLCLLFAGMSPSETKAADATEIWSFKDLLKVAEDPAGSYIMMADIDLKGRVWTPVDFSGTFDGNGHAILNASINSAGAQKRASYDGNMNTYDTAFSGFFSSLSGAKVSNLKVLGLEISLDTGEATFIGGIAGYMENSEITDCSLYGKATLYTSGPAFGVGGIVGFGNGVIRNTVSEMTLISVDKDRMNPNEQFLGGAYASGYIDLIDNQIKLDGYDSDHGFVHNGGLVGMYFLYPEGAEHAGTITGNSLSGQLTFFADNEEGNASCDAFIGEVCDESFEYDSSIQPENLKVTQVEDVDTVLLPHNCSNPQFEQNVIASTKKDNGHTEYRCTTCGYLYHADYTPVIGNYVDLEDAYVPGVPPAKTAETGKSGGNTLLIIIIAAVVALIILAVILLMIRKKKVDRAREERRLSRNRKPDLGGFDKLNEL